MADKQIITEIITNIQALEPDEAWAVIKSAQDVLYTNQDQQVLNKVSSVIKELIDTNHADEKRIAFYLSIYVLNSYCSIPFVRLQPVFNKKISWLKECKSQVSKAFSAKRKTDFEQKLINYYTLIINNL